MTTLTPPAGILLALLRRGPRTWHALAAAGLDRADVLTAVGELVGIVRVRVGPILVELETGPDCEEVPCG